MKSIMLGEYYQGMGLLIDLEDETDYNMKHIPGSINIPYEKLLYNNSRLLNKNDTYYLYCNGGHKSKKAVNILSAMDYNVIQVIIK